MPRPLPSLRLLVFAIAVIGFVPGGATPASAQTISYLGVPLDIGSGLQSGLLRAQLSTSAHGGVTVHIESADTTLAFVSDAEQTPGAPFVDIFVPNGSTTANFWIQALEDTLGTVTITASAPGFTSKVDSIDIMQPGIRLLGVISSVDAFASDDNFQVQVGLPTSTHSTLQAFQAARAGGPGLTATVSHSNAAAGQLVTTALTAQVVSVVVLPGQFSSGPNVALGGVAFDGTAAGVTEITSSIPGFVATVADTKSVTVTPPFIDYTGPLGTIGSGLETGQKRARFSGAQHGGVTLHIEPSDTLLALVSTASNSPGEPFIEVFVANGGTQVNFYLHALEGVTGNAAITATATGFIEGVDTVRIVDPALRIASLATSIDVFDPPDVFVVQIGIPNQTMTTLQTTQRIRPGAPALDVTLTSSDAIVGGFVTNSDTSDVVTVQIATGQFNTPGSIGTGGVAFDAIAIGNTEVTASIPGFVATQAGSVSVAVTQPTISMVNLPANGAGAGLQVAGARAVLGAAAHGGVTVRIKSDDTQILLLSSHVDSVGVDSIDVFLPNNFTTANFYIHGVEDTIGTVNITATAPGFGGASGNVDVVQPSVRIVPGDLASTLDTIDPPDAFRAQTGIPVSGGTSLLEQNVRAGSPGIAVTFAVDDSLVAILETLVDTSHTVTLMVPAGVALTPFSVGTGGVALDGIATGPVTVSLSAPGFVAMTQSQKLVNITAPSINIGGMLTTIGAGLQSGQATATLSAGGHGGVTVHIQSDDAQIGLVSDGVTNLGQAGVDMFVANGLTTVNFYVHGVDDTIGTIIVTVSAPQFVSDSIVMNIVQPGVDITSLASSIDVGDVADEFEVRVGVPSSGNTFVQSPQLRRGGATPLPVAVTTTDTSVAQLATLSTSGDSVGVEIAAGATTSPITVAGGGVSLQPTAEGQTIVFASIPGFIQTGSAQRTVDVTNTTIIYLGLPSAVGAGLETNVVTAQLGNGAHGGVTVNIAVDDSSRALISANALAIGSLSIDVPVLNGQTDATFYLQAFEAFTGFVTITSTATGFATAVDSVEIVPPGVQIVMLPGSIAPTDPDAEFVVQLGAVNSDSSGIVEAQLIRAGGTPVTVTVTSAADSVGTLVTSTTNSDTALVAIGIGVGQTPATVLLGGMAFDPVNSGVTLVEATVPGYVTTEAGSLTVQVTGPAVGIGDTMPFAGFVLEQNYPNPFNPTTTIHFAIPHPANVELVIYGVRGNRVVTLVNRSMSVSAASVDWNGKDANGNPVSSGIYFYRLRAGSHTQTRKMVLLK